MTTDTVRPSVGDTLECGHILPPMPAPGGTGYARNATTGATLCYPCADESEREAFATADTFVAYVGASGSLTTWAGGFLAFGMPAYSPGVSRSGWHGSAIYSWRFRAPDGSEWYGRNAGAGRVITVRRARRNLA